jgi:hypothetical protein
LSLPVDEEAELGVEEVLVLVLDAAELGAVVEAEEEATVEREEEREGGSRERGARTATADWREREAAAVDEVGEVGEVGELDEVGVVMGENGCAEGRKEEGCGRVTGMTRAVWLWGVEAGVELDLVGVVGVRVRVRVGVGVSVGVSVGVDAKRDVFAAPSVVDDDDGETECAEWRAMTEEEAGRETWEARRCAADSEEGLPENKESRLEVRAIALPPPGVAVDAGIVALSPARRARFFRGGGARIEGRGWDQKQGQREGQVIRGEVQEWEVRGGRRTGEGMGAHQRTTQQRHRGRVRGGQSDENRTHCGGEMAHEHARA